MEVPSIDLLCLELANGVRDCKTLEQALQRERIERLVLADKAAAAHKKLTELADELESGIKKSDGSFVRKLRFNLTSESTLVNTSNRLHSELLKLNDQVRSLWWLLDEHVAVMQPNLVPEENVVAVDSQSAREALQGGSDAPKPQAGTTDGLRSSAKEPSTSGVDNSSPCLPVQPGFGLEASKGKSSSQPGNLSDMSRNLGGLVSYCLALAVASKDCAASGGGQGSSFTRGGNLPFLNSTAAPRGREVQVGETGPASVGACAVAGGECAPSESAVASEDPELCLPGKCANKVIGVAVTSIDARRRDPAKEGGGELLSARLPSCSTNEPAYEEKLKVISGRATSHVDMTPRMKPRALESLQVPCTALLSRSDVIAALAHDAEPSSSHGESEEEREKEKEKLRISAVAAIDGQPIFVQRSPSTDSLASLSSLSSVEGDNQEYGPDDTACPELGFLSRSVVLSGPSPRSPSASPARRLGPHSALGNGSASGENGSANVLFAPWLLSLTAQTQSSAVASREGNTLAVGQLGAGGFGALPALLQSASPEFLAGAYGGGRRIRSMGSGTARDPSKWSGGGGCALSPSLTAAGDPNPNSGNDNSRSVSLLQRPQDLGECEASTASHLRDTFASRSASFIPSAPVSPAPSHGPGQSGFRSASSASCQSSCVMLSSSCYSQASNVTWRGAKGSTQIPSPCGSPDSHLSHRKDRRLDHPQHEGEALPGPQHTTPEGAISAEPDACSSSYFSVASSGIGRCGKPGLVSGTAVPNGISHELSLLKHNPIYIRSPERPSAASGEIYLMASSPSQRRDGIVARSPELPTDCRPPTSAPRTHLGHDDGDLASSPMSSPRPSSNLVTEAVPSLHKPPMPESCRFPQQQEGGSPTGLMSSLRGQHALSSITEHPESQFNSSSFEHVGEQEHVALPVEGLLSSRVANGAPPASGRARTRLLCEPPAVPPLRPLPRMVSQTPMISIVEVVARAKLAGSGRGPLASSASFAMDLDADVDSPSVLDAGFSASDIVSSSLTVVAASSIHKPLKGHATTSESGREQGSSVQPHMPVRLSPAEDTPPPPSPPPLARESSSPSASRQKRSMESPRAAGGSPGGKGTSAYRVPISAVGASSTGHAAPRSDKSTAAVAGPTPPLGPEPGRSIMSSDAAIKASNVSKTTAGAVPRRRMENSFHGPLAVDLKVLPAPKSPSPPSSPASRTPPSASPGSRQDGVSKVADGDIDVNVGANLRPMQQKGKLGVSKDMDYEALKVRAARVASRMLGTGSSPKTTSPRSAESLVSHFFRRSNPTQASSPKGNIAVAAAAAAAPSSSAVAIGSSTNVVAVQQPGSPTLATALATRALIDVESPVTQPRASPWTNTWTWCPQSDEDGESSYDSSSENTPQGGGTAPTRLFWSEAESGAELGGKVSAAQVAQMQLLESSMRWAKGVYHPPTRASQEWLLSSGDELRNRGKVDGGVGGGGLYVSVSPFMSMMMSSPEGGS